MSQIKRIGIDTSKAVFTLHGVDRAGQPVLRTNLRRAQMIPFFKNLPPTEIAMEACTSSHHWARLLAALGHTVRLLPPQYVKPFVKRGKNDRNDAEAICEAAGRPSMRFVPVKSTAQQAEGMVLKVRETLVGQRTQLVNALRGHAAEFGVIAAKGIRQIPPLLEAIAAETAIPSDAREMLALFGQEIEHLDTRLKAIEVKLIAMHKANPISRLLAEPEQGIRWENQEKWSRYLMFHETFSSANQLRKIFLSADAVGIAVRPTECAHTKWWAANVGTNVARARYPTQDN